MTTYNIRLRLEAPLLSTIIDAPLLDSVDMG